MSRSALAALLIALGPVTAQAAPITLTTSDGVAISADAVGTGTTGIVLLHEKGRDRQAWTNFPERLAAKGMQVVNVDLRGHGASASGKELAQEDYVKMTADVNAAVTWLAAHGATRISVVGAELGANLAVVEAVDDKRVSDVVLLSPGMSVAGVNATQAITQLGTRQILVVTAASDAYGMRTASFFEGKGGATVHVEVLDGATSGTKMLVRSPDLDPLLQSWFNGAYFGANADPGATKDLTTGDTSGIETTGTKFEERRERERKTPLVPAEAPPPADPMPELNLDD